MQSMNYNLNDINCVILAALPATTAGTTEEASTTSAPEHKPTVGVNSVDKDRSNPVQIKPDGSSSAVNVDSKNNFNYYVSVFIFVIFLLAHSVSCS